MWTGDSQIYIPNLDFYLEMQTYTSTTSQVFPLKSPTGPPNLACTNTSLCSLPQWHYHPSFAQARSNSVILLSITSFSHCLGSSISISKGMSALFRYFLTVKMLQCDYKLEFTKESICEDWTVFRNLDFLPGSLSVTEFYPNTCGPEG